MDEEFLIMQVLFVVIISVIIGYIVSTILSKTKITSIIRDEEGNITEVQEKYA